MTISAPIAVVGNINLDIKTTLIPASSEILQDGETAVEDVYESLGGGGTNIAVAAARLGGTVHFGGCVGSDTLGKRLETALSSFGVVPHLKCKPGVTGRSINLIWNNHHRHFVSCLPNNRALTFEDIDFSALTAAGCTQLFRGDVWFSESMLRSGNLELFRRARAAEMETSLDINWDPVWNSGADSSRATQRKQLLKNVLPHISWIHGNEAELNLFSGLQKIKESCRFLIDNGCKGVIVHCGERGAAAYLDDRWLEIPPVKVQSVVSETGSGDVFSAAFLVFSSLPLLERLNKCSEIAAQHIEGHIDLLPRIK